MTHLPYIVASYALKCSGPGELRSGLHPHTFAQRQLAVIDPPGRKDCRTD